MENKVELNVAEAKTCSCCKTFLPYKDFYKCKGSRNGLRSECKKCRRLRESQYYQSNKELFRARSRKYLYGITQLQFEELWINQNGCCPICNVKLERTSGRKKDSCHVDHSHKTLKVRALLCLQCNSLLGMARDSGNILQAAIGYLKQYE